MTASLQNLLRQFAKTPVLLINNFQIIIHPEIPDFQHPCHEVLHMPSEIVETGVLNSWVMLLMKSFFISPSFFCR
jgi:hypothetical protein